MFDAKSILDALVSGGAKSPPAPSQAFGNPQPDSPSAHAGAKGIQEILGSAFGREGDQGGSLQDALRNLLGQSGQADDALNTLKQILGQATSGVREGAGQIDEATGVSQKAREAIQQATGQTPEQLVEQLKQMVANNRTGAGAALGGLGALILGTQAGRSLAGSAIKIGGLALVGGLAYKAYQNYQQGLPPLTGTTAAGDAVAPAPRGSGFEPDAISHDSAMLYVRAMIAAAAADGRIDDNERQKLLAGIKQAGMEQGAQEFLTKELMRPATVEELASSAKSEKDAVQLYTAARLAVDHDSLQESDFLKRLAAALRLNTSLTAQVDATAKAAA